VEGTEGGAVRANAVTSNEKVIINGNSFNGGRRFLHVRLPFFSYSSLEAVLGFENQFKVSADTSVATLYFQSPIVNYSETVQDKQNLLKFFSAGDSTYVPAGGIRLQSSIDLSALAITDLITDEPIKNDTKGL
jgi:hypothetical protein